MTWANLFIPVYMQFSFFFFFDKKSGYFYRHYTNEQLIIGMLWATVLICFKYWKVFWCCDELHNAAVAGFVYALISGWRFVADTDQRVVLTEFSDSE